MLSRIGAAIRSLEVLIGLTLVSGVLQWQFGRTMAHGHHGILEFEHASADHAAQIVRDWTAAGAAGSARMQLLIDFVYIVGYVGAVVAGCWYVWRCVSAAWDRSEAPPSYRPLIATALVVVGAAAAVAGGCDVAENIQLLRALNGHHVSGAGFARVKFDLIEVAAPLALLAVIATLFASRVREQWVAAHKQLVDRIKGGPAEPRPVILDPVLNDARPVRAGTARKTIGICCSGGGIRSASFNLGVLQVLMRKGIYQKSSIISAVSGGSYTASALAVARATSDEGALTAQSPAFAPGSPEERRLRTHMHYLLPDLRVATAGLLALLFGFAANLGVIIAVAYAAARIAGWLLHTWAGPSGFDTATASLHFATWTWALCAGIGAAALAGYVFAEKVFPMYRSRDSDGRLDSLTGQPALKQVAAEHGLSDPSATAFRAWGYRLVVAGATLSAVLLGLPAVIAGLNNLATHNNPTTTVAGLISDVGFTTKNGCVAGATADYVNQRAAARTDALLQVDQPTAFRFTYGACGQTFTGLGLVANKTGNPRFLHDSLHSSYQGEGTSPTRGIGGTLLALLLLMKTTIGNLRKGNEATTGTKSGAAGVLGRLPERIRGYLAPWAGTAIAVVLLLAISLRSAQLGMVEGVTYRGLWHVMAIFGGVLLLPFVTNANRTSLHTIYRERLATVFSVRRTKDGKAEELPYAQPLLWSQLKAPDDPKNLGTAGPELIICATANVEDVGLVPPGRGGAPFAFSREAIGIGALSPRMWASAADYEAAAGPGALTIPASVAISGAAVSPVMGRMTRRPVRLLLGLANVRLGVWLPNPLHIPDQAAKARAPRWWQRAWQQWRTPGVSALLREMVGRNSIHYRFIYVTDGGHYDNLGLVEALRRQPGLIYVIDGSGDKPPYWTTLGHAISLARADLGIEITLDADPPMPADGDNSTNIVTGDITYPDGTIGRIVVGKCVKVAKSAYDVEVYGHDDPAFPNKSTGDQLFGDLEFESYRKFGNLTGELMTTET